MNQRATRGHPCGGSNNWVAKRIPRARKSVSPGTSWGPPNRYVGAFLRYLFNAFLGIFIVFVVMFLDDFANIMGCRFDDF